MPNLSWRNALILGVAILVAVYTVSVLAYVRSNPDIGLHCTFSTRVNRVFPEYLRPEIDGGTIPSLFGAEIRSVGQPVFPARDKDIETWPEFLRRVRDLREKPEENPIQAVDPVNTEGLSHIVRDGEELVRVRLRLPGDGKEVSVWCLVGKPPLATHIPSVLWFLLDAGLLAIGALVFWKRPGDRAATQLFVLSIVVVGAYMGGYHWEQIVTQPVLLVVYTVCAAALPAALLHFYAVFPRPKWWMEQRPGLSLIVIYAPSALFVIVILAGYIWVRTLFRDAAPSASVAGALDRVKDLIYAYFGIAALWYLASTACLVHSYRTATDERERNQLKWMTVGAVLALVPIGYVLYLAVFHPQAFGGGGATWPMFAASVCFMGTFTVSITRYRLLQLDQLLGSGMIYFLISFVAGLMYYGLVFLGMLLVGSQFIPGPSLGQALWVSSTALVLMMSLDFIRRRFLLALDRRYHREKHQLDRTLARLGQAIEQLVDPPTLARRLLHASADLLNVPGGAVYLADEGGRTFRLAGSVGSLTVPAEVPVDSPLVSALTAANTASVTGSGTPIAARGHLRALGGAVAVGLAPDDRLMAVLVLGPKPSGSYTPDDLNLLAAFAQISAPALSSAAGHRTIEVLNRDLQEKVEKISEQQGRIHSLQKQLMLLSRVQTPTAESAEVSPRPTATETATPADPKSDRQIVGSSPEIGQLLGLVQKVASSPAAVLIRGESGTGKELVARAVHMASPRAEKPFVTVHCAALSSGVLESELFGHVKGAFTGALAARTGRFEVANGGTLFLDEIGDVSLEVQTKLLRVLQEMTFERVGSSTPIKVDVRVIAATHQNLEQLIRLGRFREDLFYRLNVIPITLPPLRERREDIPELAMHFLQSFAPAGDRLPWVIDDEALRALKAYDWPGNIRELRNMIERSVVVADGPVLTLADLPVEITQAVNRPLWEPRPVTTAPKRFLHSGTRQRRSERERQEREELVRALAEAGGNKAEAARSLGLARSTLVSRMRKYGMLRKEQ